MPNLLDRFSALTSGARNLVGSGLSNLRQASTARAGQALNAVKSAPAAARSAIQNMSSRGEIFANSGRALGRAASHLPSPMTAIKGYVPIAALGQAAYDWGQIRGVQMDQDPAVQQQMADIRTAAQNGYVPLDDGNFLNLQTNEISSYDQLLPSLREQQTPTTDGSAYAPQVTMDENGNLSLENSASTTTPEPAAETTTQQVTATAPQATVDLPTTTMGSNPVTTKPANTKTKTSSSKKGGNEDKPKQENQISGFDALIPLLAMGGLGYFLARR